MNFSIIYGSYRDVRAGIRLAHYLIKKTEERGHNVEFFDAKEINLPMLNKRHSDYEKGQAPEPLESISKSFHNTDAFILVCGEYNYGLQPGLKNFLDHFLHEYQRRPGALAIYSGGSFGGWRAAMHMYDSMIAMGMPPVPSVLTLPKIKTQLDENAKPLNEELDKRAHYFLESLEWYAQALKIAREK